MCKLWEDLIREYFEELSKDEEGRAELKRIRERGAILRAIEIERERAIEAAEAAIEKAEYKKEVAKRLFEKESLSNEDIIVGLGLNIDEINELAEKHPA